MAILSSPSGSRLPQAHSCGPLVVFPQVSVRQSALKMMQVLVELTVVNACLLPLFLVRGSANDSMCVSA